MKGGTSMIITTYAAIDVGSNGLSMKIYEVSKGKGIVELTHIRHKLSIGSEIFANHQITYKTLSEICRVLKDFKKIMEEYNVTAYQAYSGDALREASNRLIVLDQIKLQTNIKVKILSNSEQRFLYYKAISMKESYFDDLIDEGALIVDMSAGSVQFSFFRHGVLEFTQNLKLGSTRINELLHTMESEVFHYNELILDYLDKDLTTFYNLYLSQKKVRHIIAVGSNLPEIKARLSERDPDFQGLISRKDFEKIKNASHLGLAHMDQILPTLLLFKKIGALTKCNDLYLSAIDLCDSMVADYAERREKIRPAHDFSKDIIESAKNIAIRYQCDMAHIENVVYLATEIFDNIRKLHGLGKRERLLLQIAVILHSCGAFVNMAQTRENSYKIIMSTEIIGISHIERVMVANIVRYNNEYFPDYQEIDEEEITKDQYITIVKLCAILKLANVLDKSNHQRIQKVRMSLKENSLQITAYTLQDITLEKGLFHRKADVFEEVFGIRPVLKKKEGLIK